MAVQSRITELSVNLSKELNQSLGKMLDKTRSEQGVELELAKVLQLKATLSGMANHLGTEASKDAANAQKAASHLKVLVAPLKSWFRTLFTSKSKQDAAVLQFQTSIGSSVAHHAKLGTQRIVQVLLSNLEDRLVSTNRRMDNAKRQLDNAIATAEANRSGKRLTTESMVELDVATAETDRLIEYLVVD